MSCAPPSSSLRNILTRPARRIIPPPPVSFHFCLYHSSYHSTSACIIRRIIPVPPVMARYTQKIHALKQYKETLNQQVPKTDKSDPRRLKKEMPKMLKSIGSEDRIVFVGITNSPWNCDVKVGCQGSVFLACSSLEKLD